MEIFKRLLYYKYSSAYSSRNNFLLIIIYQVTFLLKWKVEVIISKIHNGNFSGVFQNNHETNITNIYQNPPNNISRGRKLCLYRYLILGLYKLSEKKLWARVCSLYELFLKLLFDKKAIIYAMPLWSRIIGSYSWTNIRHTHIILYTSAPECETCTFYGWTFCSHTCLNLCMQFSFRKLSPNKNK